MRHGCGASVRVGVPLHSQLQVIGSSAVYLSLLRRGWRGSPLRLHALTERSPDGRTDGRRHGPPFTVSLGVLGDRGARQVLSFRRPACTCLTPLICFPALAAAALWTLLTMESLCSCSLACLRGTKTEYTEGCSMERRAKKNIFGVSKKVIGQICCLSFNSKENAVWFWLNSCRHTRAKLGSSHSLQLPVPSSCCFFRSF